MSSRTTIGERAPAEIYKVGTNGSQPTVIADLKPGDGIAIEPAWLSDENRIAFVKGTVGHSTLAFVAPDSTTVEVAPWSLVATADDLRRTHFDVGPDAHE